MGIVTSLVRATSAELDRFIAHPDELNEFLWKPERLDPPSGYLDKSIDGIQAMLDASSVRLNLAPIYMPGEPIHDGTAIYFAIYPEPLHAMAEKLAQTSRETLAANYTADDAEYVLYNYDKLEKFVHHAVSENLGAIMSHN